MFTEFDFKRLEISSLVLSADNARDLSGEQSAARRIKFAELVESIREKGILEPLIVRDLYDGRYEIIAGERRYRAMQQVLKDAGERFLTLPCMVALGIEDDEAIEIGLIENLQRDDLTPFEAAEAFKRYLANKVDQTAAAYDLSLKTGIPAHAIRRQVRLLDLPQQILDDWKQGNLSAGHVEMFSRIGDNEIALRAHHECRRRKMSIRELRDYTTSISPSLERGFFDKADCQTCASNSGLQSGLFGEEDPGSQCLNPSCFETKQELFLQTNWGQSKAAKTYGTLGFRFGHRVGQEQREPIVNVESAGRCLECPQFVSVVRLTGEVVSMYEKTCVGPRNCFEELYRKRPETEPEPEAAEEQQEQVDSIPVEKPEASLQPAQKKEEPKKNRDENTGPINNPKRAEVYREKYLETELPARISKERSDAPQPLRLLILSLALTSQAARNELYGPLGLKSSDSPVKVAAEVFEIPVKEAPIYLREMATALIMSKVSIDITPAVRLEVAKRFGIEMHTDWRITEGYLQSLKRDEIIRLGEEKNVKLWSDEVVRTYRDEHFPNKALASLKKDQLISLVMESGVDLAGRVPAEILGGK